jgi:hypothetical protein
VTDKPIELDSHRGMQAQKATTLRRLLAEVEANEESLRQRQAEFEAHLVAAPAASWEEAMDKVRYILRIHMASLAAEDTRGRALVTAVLADMARLAGEPPPTSEHGA